MTAFSPTHKPALLGGTPVFSNKVSMVRPWLPPFSDLAGEFQSVMESGWLTNGPNVRALEEEVAEALQVKHAVAVSSCTSGLMLLARCLDLQGEVILPSFTFMATATSLEWKGCQPVFVDVDPQTTNVIPELVEAAITPRTSAILAVHNFGNPAQVDALEQIAQRHNIALLLDAAHGLGSTYKGQPLGGQGNAQCFSLSPTKLVTGGEGGLISTNDGELARSLRSGRGYGNPGNYDCLFPGLNARMSEFHAILARQSLTMLPSAVESRQATAMRLQKAVDSLQGLGCQEIEAHGTSSYKDFPIILDTEPSGLSRDMLRKALAAEGIDTRTYYDPPVHRQTAFRKYAQDLSLPNTEYLSQNIVCLPIWSHMPDDMADGMIEALQRILHHADEIQARSEDDADKAS